MKLQLKWQQQNKPWTIQKQVLIERETNWTQLLKLLVQLKSMHRSNNDDRNKNKFVHKTGILNNNVQSLQMENNFLKNEIHELTTLLNTIMILCSCKPKTNQMESHYKKNLTAKKHLTNWVMLNAALINWQIPMQ